MSQYRMFRKKPVVIEAIQWDGSIESAQDVIRWSGNRIGYRSESIGNPDESKRSKTVWLVVYTIEGNMQAQPNDWIIKGIKGELYPCKPDIFEATYEEVSNDA